MRSARKSRVKEQNRSGIRFFYQGRLLRDVTQPEQNETGNKPLTHCMWRNSYHQSRFLQKEV
ncbi:hypothetical protein HRH25_02705 [Flavisolibacter sp. BT320]|nr:hypothetical protein [Flavisolibacter longurius]